MQVSWIDEDELKALAARLHEAVPQPPAGTAEEADAFDLSEAFLASLMDPPPPVAAPARTEAAPESAAVAPQPVTAPPAMAEVAEVNVEMDDDHHLPEVAHIREQLKVIRDRARQAGLLPQAPPPPPPVPPLATPSPATMGSTWAPAAAAPQTPDLPAIAQAVASITEVDVSAVSPFPPVLQLPEDGTLAERLEALSTWIAQITHAEQVIVMDDYGDLLWGNPDTNDLILTAMLALSASSRSQVPGEAPSIHRSQLTGNRELHALQATTKFGSVTLALINARPFGDVAPSTLRDALLRCIEGAGAATAS